MGVVFIAFVVGTLPGLISEIADVENRDYNIFTDIFFWANVMINPIIYAFMNKSYKEAMYDVIFYKCKSKNPKIKKIPATNNNFDKLINARPGNNKSMHKTIFSNEKKKCYFHFNSFFHSLNILGSNKQGFQLSPSRNRRALPDIPNENSGKNQQIPLENKNAIRGQLPLPSDETLHSPNQYDELSPNQ